MTKISKDLSAGILHPRETLFTSGTIGANGAEILLDCDGASTVTFDMRGTFNLTVELAGTVDGINWTLIPFRMLNNASLVYMTTLPGTAVGAWVGKCSMFRKLRLRCTQYTTGAATCFMIADNAPLDDALVSPLAITATGVSGAAVTLTLPAVTGLRHLISSLTIIRFAAATLTAAATPVLVTSTNLPGSLVFPIDADAAPIGTSFTWRDNWPLPLAASAQTAATTIVCPATPSVIWRASAAYTLGQ
jgi:hypothetical protein